MDPSSQELESQNLSRDDYEDTRTRFDDVCTEVAADYGLFYPNGKPRRALIIEVIAKTACTSCIDKILREKSNNHVDAFYAECHLLACNILVEELQVQLTEKGYSVLITTEKNLEYGKVDVQIVPNRGGVDLRLNNKEVGIEVKTGSSFSFSQLFRYMLDNVDRILILWRIRNKQILLFEGTKLKPVLTHFMKMIVSRAERLLSNREMSCDHASQGNLNWTPNQQQLQEAFSAFSDGIVKTLPSLIETVIAILEGEETTDA
jgi:hypothetical protein